MKGHVTPVQQEGLHTTFMKAHVTPAHQQRSLQSFQRKPDLGQTITLKTVWLNENEHTVMWGGGQICHAKTPLADGPFRCLSPQNHGLWQRSPLNSKQQYKHLYMNMAKGHRWGHVHIRKRPELHSSHELSEQCFMLAQQFSTSELWYMGVPWLAGMP